MNLNAFLVEIMDRDSLHFQPEFYQYVYDTIVIYSRQEKFEGQNNRIQHLSPKKICSLINNRLKREFGDLSGLVLSEWGVHNSRDIGIVVFQLADGGCLKLSGQETMEDFEAGGLQL